MRVITRWLSSNVVEESFEVEQVPPPIAIRSVTSLDRIALESLPGSTLTYRCGWSRIPDDWITLGSEGQALTGFGFSDTDYTSVT